MSSGKKVVVLTSDGLWQQHHPEISGLGWQCVVVRNREDLQKVLATGTHDTVLVDGSDSVRMLLNGSSVFGVTSLAEVQRRHIVHVLDATHGNKAAAARILEIDTKTLYNRLKSYSRLGAIDRGPGTPAPGSAGKSHTDPGTVPPPGILGSGNLQQSPGREHSSRRL